MVQDTKGSFHAYITTPFLPQIPNQVTLSSEEHFTSHIPVEIAGLWLRRLSVKPHDWVLVLSSDPCSTLASHLCCRTPVEVNIVAGAARSTAADVRIPRLPPSVLLMLSGGTE